MVLSLLLPPLLDRFISSASFSAFVRIVQWLALITPTYFDARNGRLAFPNASAINDDSGPIVLNSAFSVSPLRTGLLLILMPVAVVGVMCTSSLRGVQNVCAMLAAQGLAFTVPVPTEPSGYLMVPTVLFYFGVIGGIGAALDLTINRSRALPREMEEAATTVFQQYLALFATTRAYALFVARKQGNLLGMLCVLYLVGFPTVVRLPRDAYWAKHFLTCVDGLAVRAGMLWAAGILAWWGSDAGEAAVLLPLLAVSLLNAEPQPQSPTPVMLMDKVAECHSMLSLMCAQVCVTLLCKHNRLSLTVAGLVCVTLLVLAIWLQQPPQTKHSFMDVCAFAVSLLLVTSLERFLDGCGLPETYFAYLCVFVGLECLRRQTTAATTTTTSVVLPAQATMDVNSLLWD